MVKELHIKCNSSLIFMVSSSQMYVVFDICIQMRLEYVYCYCNDVFVSIFIKQEASQKHV